MRSGLPCSRQADNAPVLCASVGFSPQGIRNTHAAIKAATGATAGLKTALQENGPALMCKATAAILRGVSISVTPEHRRAHAQSGGNSDTAQIEKPGSKPRLLLFCYPFTIRQNERTLIFASGSGRDVFQFCWRKPFALHLLGKCLRTCTATACQF